LILDVAARTYVGTSYTRARLNRRAWQRGRERKRERGREREREKGRERGREIKMGVPEQAEGRRLRVAEEMSLLKRQKRASGTHQGHQSDKTK